MHDPTSWQCSISPIAPGSHTHNSYRRCQHHSRTGMCQLHILLQPLSIKTNDAEIILFAPRPPIENIQFIFKSIALCILMFLRAPRELKKNHQKVNGHSPKVVKQGHSKAVRLCAFEGWDQNFCINLNLWRSATGEDRWAHHRHIRPITLKPKRIITGRYRLQSRMLKYKRIACGCLQIN